MFGGYRKYCSMIFDPITWRDVFYSKLILIWFNRIKPAMNLAEVKSAMLYVPEKIFNPSEYICREDLNEHDSITRSPSFRQSFHHVLGFKFLSDNARIKERQLKVDRLRDNPRFIVNGSFLNNDEFCCFSERARDYFYKSTYYRGQ